MELPDLSGGLGVIIGTSGLLLLGYLATLWSKSRQVLTKMFSFIIIPQQFNDHGLSSGVQLYLRKHGKRRRIGIRTFSAFLVFLKSLGDRRYVGYEELDDQPNLFWIGWRPVWYQPSKSEPKEGQSVKTKTMLRFIRWTFKPSHFINEGLKVMNRELTEKLASESKRETEFFVEYVVGDLRQNRATEPLPGDALAVSSGSGGVSMNMRANIALGFDWDDIGDNQGDKAFNSLVLDDNQHQLLKEIEFWLDSREWYQERSIPWHRGYVFHGVPGTGKSSFVRAVGQKFDLPLYVFDLASMDNAYLSAAWRSKCQHYRKRLILIEDIDGIFEHRKNVAAPDNVQGVTFDCLLNLIDGVDRTDGTLLFITTNNIDVLDPALGGGSIDEIGSRPGRVDRVIRLGNLDQEGRCTMAARICGEYLTDEDIDTLAGIHPSITPAGFQEVCIRIALEKKWSEKHPVKK